MIQVRNDEHSFHPPGRTTCTCTRWKRPRWRRKGTTETVNTRHLLREVKKPWTWMLPGIPLAPVDCEGFLNFVFACKASSILTSNIDQCNACFGSLGIYHFDFPGEQHRATHIRKQNNSVLGSMLSTAIWGETRSTFARKPPKTYDEILIGMEHFLDLATARFFPCKFSSGSSGQFSVRGIPPNLLPYVQRIIIRLYASLQFNHMANAWGRNQLQWWRQGGAGVSSSADVAERVCQLHMSKEYNNGR